PAKMLDFNCFPKTFVCGRCNLPLYLGSTNTLPASAYSLSRFVKLKALTPKLFSKRKSPILIKNLSSAKMERLLIAGIDRKDLGLELIEVLIGKSRSYCGPRPKFLA